MLSSLLHTPSSHALRLLQELNTMRLTHIRPPRLRAQAVALQAGMRGFPIPRATHHSRHTRLWPARLFLRPGRSTSGSRTAAETPAACRYVLMNIEKLTLTRHGSLTVQILQEMQRHGQALQRWEPPTPWTDILYRAET